MYIKVFEKENTARDWKDMKKRTNRSDEIFCLVEHPEGFAVVDLKTAIELNCCYEW